MNFTKKILIEGITSEEILELVLDPDFENEVISNEPIIFHIGSAEVLAQFGQQDQKLIVDLVHIIGGGEGVLLVIRNLVRSYCKAKGIRTIDWQIHATDCVKPNLKLKKILELKNYQILEVKNRGEVYFKTESL